MATPTDQAPGDSLKTVPGTGLLLARLMTGETPRFDPERFAPAPTEVSTTRVAPSTFFRGTM